MIPYRTPFFLPWIYPSLIWRMPTSEPTLYLTFDDGPVDGPTDFVLETLAKASVKATFFCIGDNIRKYPEALARVVAAGHALGNHTFHHLNGWRTSKQQYLDNIRMIEPYWAKSGIASPKLFRPPYGKITFRQASALRDFKIIMWDVLSFDFDKRRNADTSLRKSIAATRSGSIIVFHDSFKAEKNLKHILPRYIDHFAGQGFAFKILS
jgi:peptidoglycan/xylan/chitin deacetylase (PgdA/CDA1 family)